MSLLKKNLILALILLCCLPLKAQIILNEVMPKPASAANACDQTMAGSTGCGREYVEIYNNSDCPVDISCYILASATDPTVKGSFSFPAGTIIGARQHFVLGGPNASATAGSVDFVLNSYVSTSQMCIGSARWFLENTDGWVALYAPDGSVADAIYWTFSAGEASKLNTEPEFNESVCLPVACGPSTLLRANQMGGSITYVGQVPGVGLTFSRRPNDGGAWQRDVAPSIASNCNGTCIPVAPSFTVTGIITPNTTCTVPYSGSIDVTVTPAGSYTYSWAPGGETTQDLTELNAGTYTVTVTNTSNGCTATRSFVVTNNVSNPVLSGTTTPASCGQNTGAINLSVSGGTMPYSYSWAPNGEITEDLSGLAPGAYTVTVTGANGCSQTASFNVANNNVTINLSAVTTPNTACQTPFNGAINLSVSPAGTYTYLWDPNGETSQDLSALQPGAYTVTVTASPSGCTASATYTVTDNPNIPSLSGSTSPASCGQPTGAINLSASGGVMPYSYLWDPNGEITEDLSGLAPGAYTVTVTGANGCSQTASFNVANNNVTINLSAVTTPNTACQAPFNGAINLSVSPAGTYTYLWDPNGETSQDLSALEPGAYTVTVTASPSGCTASATYTVTDNPNRPSLSGTTTPASCGQPTGAINLSVSGGVMPYSYSWDPNGEITEDLSGLAPGAYTVTVTGANGCTQTTSFNVANNNVTINLSAVTTPNTACQAPFNGAINLSVSPAGTYTYLWDPNGETSQDLSALEPGAYTVTVTASPSGCTASATYTVTDNPNRPSLSGTTTPASCGQNTGAINLSVSGGTTPYSYLWDPNGEITEDLSGLAPGAYTVTVTGANGCTQTASFNVANNNVTINLSAVTSPNTACQAPFNGAINLSVSPAGTYTYLWDPNGETSQDLSALEPGAYTVTVTASPSGCTASATYTVTDNPNRPSLSGTTTPASCGQNTGAINLSVSGGVMPYSYSWDPNGEITEDLSGLAPGAYTVTVTGANGCTQTASFNVANNNVTINLSAATTPNTACTAPFNGSINLSVSPAGSYSYQWDPNGETSQDLSALEPGAYTVTVTASPSGCTASATYTVTDNPNRPSLTGTTTPASCGQSNGAINTTVTGGATPFNYLWAPNSETTPNLTNIQAGTYTLTVTGSNGCTTSSAFNISNSNSTFSISATTGNNTNCQAPFNGNINLSVTPVGSYTYLWDPNGASSQDLSGQAPGTYTVTVTDAISGCNQIGSYTINDAPLVPLATGNSTPSTCNTANGSIDLTVSGGVSPYTYLWLPNGETSQDLSSITAGSYTVTVSGNNGCTTSTQVSVTNTQISLSLSGIATPNTNCTAPYNGGINLSVLPTGNYTYEWSAPGAPTTQNLSALNAGTYTVTVTHSGSCTASASYVVSDGTALPTVTIASSPSSTICNGQSATLTASGTAGQYNWSQLPGNPDPAVTTVTPVTATTYTVTVTTTSGCSSSASILLNVNNLPNPTIQSNLVSCGQFMLQVIAGANDAVPYSNYSWSAPPGGSGSTITTATNGVYTVTVSDANGCSQTASSTVLVPAPLAINCSPSPSTIIGGSDGAVNITVSNGQPAFTYQLNNASPVPLPANGNITGLAAGSYSITVTDGNGCTDNCAFNINDPSCQLAVSSTAVSPSCNGLSDGQILLNITNATATPTINWGSTPGNGNNPRTNIPAGSYIVTVTSGLGCSVVNSVTVGQPDALLITGTVTNLNCNNNNTGQIDLIIQGGSPRADASG